MKINLLQRFYHPKCPPCLTIGNSVTSIGSFAFSDCTGLTSITIPNSVTSIGDNAFYNCTGLTNIVVDEGNSTYDSRDNCNAIIETATNKLIVGCRNTLIPNSVTSIGEDAFEDCIGLISITIPNSVTSIGDDAFEDCTNLTNVTIGNSVTSIGDYAFRGCTGLISVTIPNSVTSIGDDTFCGCTNLTNVTIGNSVTSIGWGAFEDCTNLTSITIPGCVTSIGERAFYGCTGLTNIVVNEGNSTYDSRDNCNAIIETATNKLIVGCRNTLIPNSVTSIGSGAFYGCTGLTSIEIPNSVTSIGYAAFGGCTGLKEVHIIDLASWWNIAFEGNGSNPLDYAHNLYLNGGLVTELVIPDGVSEIKKYAFSGCTGLTNVTIGNSVTSIGWGAFEDCTNLTSITIPGCVTSIGSKAFDNCTGLESITIPNSVTSIGYAAFGGCTGLKEVHISDLVSWCNIDFTYHDSNPLCYAHNLYLNGELITELVIPDGVNEIKQFAFRGCTGLASITIPNSVNSIGGGAFWGCTGLASITIPNSVNSIGGGAFWGCTGLKTVVNFSNLTFTKGSSDYGDIAYHADNVYNAPNVSIEDEYIFGKSNEVNKLLGYLGSATELTLPANYKGENYVIGSGAFSGRKGLKSITIPNSVTSIEERAFYKCTGLKTVINFSKLPFSKGSYNYGYIAYYADNVYNAPNGSIEDEYIFAKPNEVNTLLGYLGNAMELTLPGDIKGEDYIIGSGAFSGCSGLTSIEIPNSVTSIGEWAFYECSGLTNVVIGNGVTSIGERAFYGCTGLTNIVVNEGNSTYDSRDNCNAIIETATNKLIVGCRNTLIPNSVTTIGHSAFYNCTGLTSITIPNSVTSIEAYVFYGCTGLTRVDIVDGVKSIGYSAFAGCSNLEELYISNTIESIVDRAFEGCTNILEIKVGSKKAITGSENIFSEDVYNNALLHVPEGRKFAYEKTVPWNRFYIVETDFTDISGVKEQIAESKTVYDLQGRKVENPTNGIYIVNGKKLFVK